jgi:hypothetical protein
MCLARGDLLSCWVWHCKWIFWQTCDRETLTFRRRVFLSYQEWHCTTCLARGDLLSCWVWHCTSISGSVDYLTKIFPVHFVVWEP